MLFDELIRDNAQNSDITSLAAAQTGLAWIAEQRQDWGHAGSLCEKALAIYREQGLRFLICPTLCQLGRIAIRQGDLKRAQHDLDEGYAMSLDIFGIEYAADALAGQAWLEAHQAQYGQAARTIGAVQGLEQVFTLIFNAERARLLAETARACQQALGQQHCAALISNAAQVVRANIPTIEFDSAFEAMQMIDLRRILTLARDP